MNPNDLATKYRLLNSSFKKTMIYHIGIDAGFFTEYTYMLHAMLYCLQHKIQFKLSPTTPTSDGKRAGKTVSHLSASKCTNRFTTPTTPIACLHDKH